MAKQPDYFMVLLYPDDDNTISPDVWMVHQNPRQRKNFETTYRDAMARVRQEKPDDWSITDVVKEMQETYFVPMTLQRFVVELEY